MKITEIKAFAKAYVKKAIGTQFSVIKLIEFEHFIFIAYCHTNERNFNLPLGLGSSLLIFDKRTQSINEFSNEEAYEEDKLIKKYFETTGTRLNNNDAFKILKAYSIN